MNRKTKGNRNIGKKTYANAKNNTRDDYKRQHKNKRKDCKDNINEDVDNGRNNPSWYGADPAILRDAASIPFSWATGSQTVLQTSPSVKHTIPGICTISLVPTVGVSDSPNSAVNIAMNSMYTYVRHANSGHANYQSTDLMIYVLSMSQIYSYINFLMRIYGMASLYSQRNRYLPTALLRANYVDPQSIMDHMADFRSGINILINKAASFAVPDSMTIFQRHAFLYQNLYTEGTSIKDQLYMYVPYSFLQYGEVSEKGANLTSKAFIKGTPYTYDELLKYGNDLLNPLVASEDIGIMSGDILKAFGGNILKLASLPEVFEIMPVFDIGVLEQMHNATLIPYADYSVTQEIDEAQLTTWLKAGMGSWGLSNTQTRILTGYSVTNRSVYLTTTTADTSPELVMESSRLMARCDSTITSTNTSSNVTFSNFTYGTEIPVLTTIWYFSGAGEQFQLNSKSYDSFMCTIPSISYTDVKNGAWASDITNYSQFRFAPLMPLWSGAVASASTGNPYLELYNGYYLGMIDNYAVLNKQDIARLHDAAVLNELNVPFVSRV